jgi:hypothetical protein
MTFCTDCAKNNQLNFLARKTLENKTKKKQKKRGLAFANPLKNKKSIKKNLQKYY